ncbi:solute carrier family 23 protein, partial [Tsukamurella pulmonis]
LSPMAAAAFSVIPGPVLGGAGIVLFGTVAASGIRTLSTVDFRGNNNLIIVAASLAFGLIPVVSTDFWHAFPAWFVVIFHSGISAAAIVAVTLNLLFNVIRPNAGARSSSDQASDGASPLPATTVRVGEGA